MLKTLLAAPLFTSPAALADTCAGLSKLTLPNTTVTKAETVAAGARTAGRAARFDALSPVGSWPL